MDKNLHIRIGRSIAALLLAPPFAYIGFIGVPDTYVRGIIFMACSIYAYIFMALASPIFLTLVFKNHRKPHLYILVGLISGTLPQILFFIFNKRIEVEFIPRYLVAGFAVGIMFWLIAVFKRTKKLANQSSEPT